MQSIHRIYTKNKPAMKLAVMTNPYEVMFETDIINRLFREGLEELHLRKPAMSKIQLLNFINAIDSSYHNRIVIHSFYGLAKKFQLGGIQLDSSFRKNWLLNWIVNKVILRGIAIKKYSTIHSYKSLYHTLKGVDEVLIGPVFRKVSDHICNPMIKRDSLQKAISHSQVKVTGIGSVCLETISDFKAMGFDGVIVQSAIWKSSDPVQAYVALRDFELNALPMMKVVGKE